MFRQISSSGFPLRKLLAMMFLFVAQQVSSQNLPFWSNSGNSINANDWLGSTNNAALRFRTNNVQRMSLSSTGVLQVNDLSGAGTGFATLDASGNFTRANFTSDPASYLGGDGNFHPIAAVAGWAINGYNIYNSNPGNVGIGTNNPVYLLHVNGDAYVGGNLIANSISGVQSFSSDTIKSRVEMEVGNKLCMEAGSLAGVCTKTGDLTLQSHAGANGNTILNTGTTGNVGIGTFTPAYKLDVNGEMRITSSLLIHRILPLPGDSEIHFGDSSVVIGWNNTGSGNYITANPSGTIRGLLVGYGSGRAIASSSLAFGRNVSTTSAATFGIAMGCGPVQYGGNMTNAIPYSLAVGFNSTVPTFFVGPASSTDPIGKVGIGTTSPNALLQVGNGYQSVDLGEVVPNTTNENSISYIGLNAAPASNNSWQFQSNGSYNGGVLMMGTINGGMKFISVKSETSPGNNAQNVNETNLDDHTAIEIRPDGRVMIGTGRISQGGAFDDADTRMTVDGRIMCKDLIVSKIADWPDYVFSNTHQLMNLDSLGNYVSAYHHLPAFKSAEEMETNGASLTELCKLQQQQIEELTLYILEMNKRMKALEENSNTNSTK